VFYLILSDIHANLEALRVVLADARIKEFDAVLLLGDVVGYGPDPDAVIATIEALPIPVHSVRGNHDRVACGITGAENFHSRAAAAAVWTASHISPSSRRFLQALDTGPKEVGPGLSICHGAPHDEDDYILGAESAGLAFAATSSRVTFFGHSHLPSRFQELNGEIDLSLVQGNSSLELLESDRYLLNPGSVGQPRDRDPRASYMTYRTTEHRVRWKRVEYPVEQTAKKMRSRGLPEPMVVRLFVGE